MAWARGRQESNLPTIPSTIGEEKLINPFMRTHEKVIQDHFQLTDPIELMDALRKDKDNFKPR